MILKDSTGMTYKAHFRHIRHERPHFLPNGKQYAVETECAFHVGECAKKERPCHTPQTVVGRAMCSVLDIFERSIGHKIAFERAIHALPRNIRRELWGGYFQQHSRPRPNSVRNHGNFKPKEKEKTHDANDGGSSSAGDSQKRNAGAG